MKRRIFIIDTDIDRIIQKRYKRKIINYGRKNLYQIKKEKNLTLFISSFIIIETFLLIAVVNNLI